MSLLAGFSFDMALKDVVKVDRKTFFNPRAWFGYDSLKEETRTIWDYIKDLVIPPKPTREETFEQAMERMQVTDSDLQTMSKNYFRAAMMFLALAAGMFIYAFFLLIHYIALGGFALGIAVCALFLAQAFRFHFWYFQIKQRKLGCTFAEWRAEAFKR